MMNIEELVNFSVSCNVWLHSSGKILPKREDHFISAGDNSFLDDVSR